LVPESKISDVCDALNAASFKQFDWSISHDDPIQDIQIIPSSLAHPIRSCIETLPSGKTETELLDFMIHGESFFTKQYVVLDFVDGKRGYTGKAAFEITKKEHLDPFVKAIDKIMESSGPDGDMPYLDYCTCVDRGEFLSRYAAVSEHHVVDNAQLQQFQEDAESDDVGEWAMACYDLVLWK
jgi:hypothetical protein